MNLPDAIVPHPVTVAGSPSKFSPGFGKQIGATVLSSGK